MSEENEIVDISRFMAGKQDDAIIKNSVRFTELMGQRKFRHAWYAAKGALRQLKDKPRVLVFRLLSIWAIIAVYLNRHVHNGLDITFVAVYLLAAVAFNIDAAIWAKVFRGAERIRDKNIRIVQAELDRSVKPK